MEQRLIFYIDCEDLEPDVRQLMCISKKETQEQIDKGIPIIHTMNLDLLDTKTLHLGYKIFVSNGKEKINVKLGLNRWTSRTIKDGDNIRKLACLYLKGDYNVEHKYRSDSPISNFGDLY